MLLFKYIDFVKPKMTTNLKEKKSPLYQLNIVNTKKLLHCSWIHLKICPCYLKSALLQWI